jgi:hypothetical protein
MHEEHGLSISEALHERLASLEKKPLKNAASADEHWLEFDQIEPNAHGFANEPKVRLQLLIELLVQECELRQSFVEVRAFVECQAEFVLLTPVPNGALREAFERAVDVLLNLRRRMRGQERRDVPVDRRSVQAIVIVSPA